MTDSKISADLSEVYDFLEQEQEAESEVGQEQEAGQDSVAGLSDVYDVLERLYEEDAAGQEAVGSVESEDAQEEEVQQGEFTVEQGQQWTQADVEAFWAAVVASGGLEGVRIPFSTEGLVSWRVEPSRDANGRVLRAKEARDSPAELIISSDEGVVEDVVIVLTPEVLGSMLAALVRLDRLYSDPVKASVSWRERRDRIVKWHLQHKFLGAFSIIFMAAVVFFVVRGMFELAF